MFWSAITPVIARFFGVAELALRKTDLLVFRECISRN